MVVSIQTQKGTLLQSQFPQNSQSADCHSACPVATYSYENHFIQRVSLFFSAEDFYTPRARKEIAEKNFMKFKKITLGMRRHFILVGQILSPRYCTIKIGEVKNKVQNCWGNSRRRKRSVACGDIFMSPSANRPVWFGFFFKTGILPALFRRFIFSQFSSLIY